MPVTGRSDGTSATDGSTSRGNMQPMIADCAASGPAQGSLPPYFNRIDQPYTYRVPAEAVPAPGAEPVKVEIVGTPEPKRDVRWWLTTAFPVVISATALAVAIFSLVDQQGAEQASQTAAARTYATQVSFFQDSTGSYEIQNCAPAQIYSVLLQPAPHQTLDSLGIIPAHYGITLTLSSSNRPVIYFRDANGLGWELPINGAAEPSVDPAAILAFLPRSALSIHPNINQKSQKLPDC